MNCFDLRRKASAYIDLQLDASESQRILFHLNSCRECFTYVEEIRETSDLLKNLGSVAPPRGLAGEVLQNIRVAAPRSLKIADRLRNYVLYAQPQSFSYATGFLLTCVLFISVLYSLQPHFPFSPQVSWIPWEEPQMEWVNPSVVLTEGNETSPSLRSPSVIVDVIYQASAQDASPSVLMVADVSSEGRVKWAAVVDESQSTNFKKHVEEVLKRASFTPGTKDGRPIDARAFYLFETVNIQG
jgi:hypothetical protein